MVADAARTSSLCAASSSTPLVFAEIVPIKYVASETDSRSMNHKYPQQSFPLTNFAAKQFLLHESREAEMISISSSASECINLHQFNIRWKENDGDTGSLTSLSSGYVFQNRTEEKEDLVGSVKSLDAEREFPLVYIPSDNPTIVARQPCYIVAYAYRDHTGVTPRESSNHQTNDSICHFSQDTLIRILPPELASNSNVFDRCNSASSWAEISHFRRETMLYDLLEEKGDTKISDEMIEESLQNHSEETVQELKLKMSAAMNSVRISTTFNAFRIQAKQEKEMRKIEQSVQAFSSPKFQEEAPIVKESSSGLDLESWPSLIVHSPNHGDGKTLLVQAIAKSLGCSAIHLVRPGALIAKYGIHADSALESQLHAVLVSAACRNQKVCVILDQLDMMLPARLSGRTSSGDAAIPILNAIASYLRNITDLIQRRREFPFPVKNSLYNPINYSDGSGQVFNVEICLIGVLTCPDDGWRSQKKNNGGGLNGYSIFDSIIGDRYRIPVRTAECILAAFHAAFSREGVILDAFAKAQLALIVRSAPWARGAVFRRVAEQIKRILIDRSRDDIDNIVTTSEATFQDLKRAFALVNSDLSLSMKAENSTESSISLEGRKSKPSSSFESIGGNENAKITLEDALALDPDKREILSRFGLSPPTGVLLYGPPGCGKTLLAKAIARLFKSPLSDTNKLQSQGGTFISLSVSKIASAEVGTSEKTIASSFEFAEKNAPSVSFGLTSLFCLS